MQNRLAFALVFLTWFVGTDASANSLITPAAGLPIHGGHYHCLYFNPGGGGGGCQDPSQCCPAPGQPSPRPGPPPRSGPPAPPPTNPIPPEFLSGPFAVLQGLSSGGVNEFDLVYGNAFRAVTDLRLFAGGGAAPLSFGRFHNSRYVPGQRLLGQGGHWRHSLQWEPSIDYLGAGVSFRDPTGREMSFMPADEPPESGPVTYPAATHWGHALTKNGTNYSLTAPSGWVFHFGYEVDAEEISRLRFLGFRDAAGVRFTIQTDSQFRVTRVTEPAGRYLELSYGTNGLITQVAASDGRTVTYAYDRQTISEEEYYDLLETVSYPGGLQATYQYYATSETGPPYVLATMDDPMVAGLASRVRYDYYDPSGTSTIGVIYRERHLTADTVLASLAGGLNSLTNLWLDFRVLVDSAGRTNFIDLGHSTGAAERTTNAMGFEISSFNENHVHRPNRLTNSLTGSRHFTFDDFGNFTSITNRDTADNLLSVESWTRDSSGRVLGHTNALGQATAYAYTTNGAVTRIDYPDTTYEEFAYNSFGQVTQHRLKSGGTNSYAYSTNGLCTHFSNALGHVTAYTYDAYDRLASVIDARGNTNSYTYDARGYLVKVTHPDSSWVGFGYDNYGNKTKQTNELGKVWTWNYNELSQMTNSVDPLGRTTTYEYGMGQGGCCGGGGGLSSVPTKIITPSGRTNVFEYDAVGRKSAEILAYGTAEAATNRFEYDGVGNLTNRIDALGNSWKTYFNALNQPIAAVDPLDRTNSWTYDALGNKLSETRPDNTTTTFGYDSMNRLLATTNALGHVVTYGYDVLGNLIQLVDTKGNTNQWAYGLLGHRLSKTYADSTQDRYAYDAVGNLAYFTNAASEVQSLTYDSRNRPTLKSWSSNGDTEGMTYDAAGRLTVLTNSISVITNAYDDANQLIAESSQLTAQSVRTVSYTYNSDGQRKSMTYPNGLVLTNDYTARGQLASLTFDGPPPLATYAYDARGFRTARVYENGVNAYYTNDAAGQLLALAHVKTNGGSVIAQVSHDYDLVGNRTNRTESFTGFSSATDAYSYDATDQLTGVSYSGGARTANYGYDAMGNLTNRLDTGSGTNTFTANNLNQLTAISGSAISYDMKGNLTNRPGWLYTWNAKNQLTIAEPSSPTNGAVKITFAYDAKHRCVRRQSWTWSTTTLNYQLSSSQHLVYSGWNLTEERDAGTNVVSYVHGPSIDEVVAKFTSTNTVFYHGDAQHSTLALTDASANVLERYRYEAFGLPSIFDSTFSPLSSSLYGVRHLFQGREWLAEVKLSDHRFRYYSPELQRWLNRDPLEEDGGLNLFVFVYNGPSNGIDPMGLSCQSNCLDGLVDCLNNPVPLLGVVGSGVGGVGIAHGTAGGRQRWFCRAGRLTHYSRGLLLGAGYGIAIGGAFYLTDCYSTYLGCLSGCSVPPPPPPPANPLWPTICNINNPPCTVVGPPGFRAL